jgi:hypothetical protein
MSAYFDELRGEVQVFTQNQRILLRKLDLEPATLNEAPQVKSANTSFYSKYEKYERNEHDMPSVVDDSKMEIFSGSEAQESLEDDK